MTAGKVAIFPEIQVEPLDLGAGLQAQRRLMLGEIVRQWDSRRIIRYFADHVADFKGCPDEGERRRLAMTEYGDDRFPQLSKPRRSKIAHRGQSISQSARFNHASGGCVEILVSQQT